MRAIPDDPSQVAARTATPAGGPADGPVGRPAVARPQWQALEAAHHRRVDAALRAHLERRRTGIAHPVEDFLFTYYAHSPAALRRWHPGLDRPLAQVAAGQDRAGWRHYRFDAAGDLVVDVADLLERRGATAEFVRALLARTADRPAQFGCFGLHEWAMVYRQSPAELRHAGVPLRLGAAGTNAVLERNPVRCTHFDAFRFFTPHATGLNADRLSPDTRLEMEQPGCLHVGMDLYKWAYQLVPAVPSDLVMDCFELARAIREVDMRASPYDLRSLGYEPIPIETPAGRATYVAHQRRFVQRGSALRLRLRRVVDSLFSRDPGARGDARPGSLETRPAPARANCATPSWPAPA